MAGIYIGKEMSQKQKKQLGRLTKNCRKRYKTEIQFKVTGFPG